MGHSAGRGGSTGRETGAITGTHRVRVRVRVRGTVQGVGFRPFVHRLAHEEGLGGHVLNNARGVEIELEGERDAVTRLLARLVSEAPPLAVIETVTREEIGATGSTGFVIVASTRGGEASDAVIAPDTATCADCRRELLDPTDRRYRYPFTNCTNCGPRLTIVEGVPYDRVRTTMAPFVMCAACEREYRDPVDRRFHAQPNACPVCGPRVALVDPDGVALVCGEDPVRAAAALVAGGSIVAIKGLGGYHLAVDATDAAAVAQLRRRKHRECKPFALMVADVATARRLIEVGPAAAELLASPAAPIVLAPRRDGAVGSARTAGAGAAATAAGVGGAGAVAVADGVAPGAPELGVMLAYTPLHHLLLADLASRRDGPAVLVMTSGNVSDEPIAFADDDALTRLRPIADALLVHDRPIRTRVDDSVVRACDGRSQMLRRSRGFVPSPLSMGIGAGATILGCGAELKSTFCLARGRRAWLSHHIGDLEHHAARLAYEDGITHFCRVLELTPSVVAHDLHPGYASTAYAQGLEGVRLLAVQHHHAHLAACLAEHGCGPEEVAVGAIYDGTGYGLDGSVWGGEVLVGGPASFRRAGMLAPVRMPGGEAAIREPWRMACAWLAAVAENDGEPARDAGDRGHAAARATSGGGVPVALAGHVDGARWQAVGRVANDPALSPVTTSMGRLFDAVAALCGIAPRIAHEGQAAIELTAAVDLRAPRRYEVDVDRAGAGAGAGRSAGPGPVGGPRPGEDPRPARVMDPRPLIAAVAADVAAGVDIGAVAGGVHVAIAEATASVCAAAAREAETDTVVLSGGVFQNPVLLALTETRLQAIGLRVLTPQRVPPNDGGIAYGQAVIAAATVANAAGDAG